VDGQVQVPPTAAERKGVQPVVTLNANGGVRAEVAVGETVEFSAVIEVPPGAGTVVIAEWDFQGAGDYPVKEKFDDSNSSQTRVPLKTTYAFSKSGTYFPALRAT
jgi:purine nucleoside phosphorylase